MTVLTVTVTEINDNFALRYVRDILLRQNVGRPIESSHTLYVETLMVNPRASYEKRLIIPSPSVTHMKLSVVNAGKSEAR